MRIQRENAQVNHPNMVVDNSRLTLQFSSVGVPAADETQSAQYSAQFVEAICGKGNSVYLNPQQRVPLPPPEKALIVREGMLAIDAMPAKGKLQILEFFVAGDVVSAPAFLPTSRISLRAITSVSLISVNLPTIDQAVASHNYWKFLATQCSNQLARVNIHQLMIGRLETEPRVASFLLSLALRSIREDRPEISVALPMSRVDIANYLVINCDTLSRTMMRFCDCGLIERKSRHAIRVIDLDALRKKSPLASLMSAVFEKGICRQAISFGRYAERDASMPSVHENHGVIPLVVTTGPLSRSSAEYPYASRGGC